jgi:hypothetical protein
MGSTAGLGLMGYHSQPGAGPEQLCEGGWAAHRVQVGGQKGDKVACRSIAKGGQVLCLEEHEQQGHCWVGRGAAAGLRADSPGGHRRQSVRNRGSAGTKNFRNP